MHCILIIILIRGETKSRLGILALYRVDRCGETVIEDAHINDNFWST